MKREWIFACTGALVGGLLSGGGVFIFMRQKHKKMLLEFNDFVSSAYSKVDDESKAALFDLMKRYSSPVAIYNIEHAAEESSSNTSVNVSNVNIMKKEFTPSQAMNEMTARMSLDTTKVQTDDNEVEIITEQEFGESFIGDDGDYHDYPLVEYRWYIDNVLCNENDEPVNARELLSDPILAEYQDKYFKSGDLPDTMYVRVHKLKLDIEIVGDPQSFKDDILPTLPHVGLEVGVTDPDDDPFRRTYDD